MDKKTIVLTFILPLVIVISSIINLRNATEGFADIAAAIGIFIGLVTAVVSAIVLFVLRNKNLKWWQGLLISLGSLVIVFSALIIFTRISS